MNNKILLGVVAVATLLVGLVIGSHLSSNKTSQTSGLLGGAQTAALHNTNSSITTNWDTGYFWGDLEVRGTTWIDGALNVSSTATFAGASAFGNATFTGITSTNGNFTNLSWTNGSGANTTSTNMFATLLGATNATFTSVTTTNLSVTNCTGCGGSLSTYAMFYGLTAGTGNGGATDYPATIAVKTSAGTGRVPFPRSGPTSGTITGGGVSTTAFTIPVVGTYQVTFTVHTTEPGELQLELNGIAQPQTTVDNANPTSGGHLFSGNSLLTTTSTNSVLAVINPAGNSPALTITPADGASTNAVAQTLTILRIQ